jgi:hypothetical protein
MIRLKKPQSELKTNIRDGRPCDRQKNVQAKHYFRVLHASEFEEDKKRVLKKCSWKPNKEKQPYGKKFQLKINKDVFFGVQFS